MQCLPTCTCHLASLTLLGHLTGTSHLPREVKGPVTGVCISGLPGGAR